MSFLSLANFNTNLNDSSLRGSFPAINSLTGGYFCKIFSGVTAGDKNGSFSASASFTYDSMHSCKNPAGRMKSSQAKSKDGENIVELIIIAG